MHACPAGGFQRDSFHKTTVQFHKTIVQFGIPSRAVDFMQAHDLPDNVLSDFSWGDYLI
jgi:hypothetical protein